MVIRAADITKFIVAIVKHMSSTATHPAAKDILTILLF